MKKAILTLAMALVATLRLSAAETEDVEVSGLTLSVEDVSFRQRYPWNGLVDIDCTINCSDPTTNILLYVSGRDGVTGKELNTRSIWLESDVSHTRALQVKSGTHRLVWDAAADNPYMVSDDVIVEVQAFVGDYPLYMVVDLSGGKDASSYPVTYLDDVPQGGWTDEYKTEKLVLRRIPAGTFTMGTRATDCPGDVDYEIHDVTISKPFYIGVFQVTQKQYEFVMGVNPSSYPGEMRPVDDISWNTIRGSSRSCNWPNFSDVNPTTFMGAMRAKTGMNEFDLPTESQWEYACRAGTTTALNSGKNLTNWQRCDNMAEIGRYGLNKDDGKGGYSAHTTVGSYPANNWGLYDMHGNVWEWCLDWYGWSPIGHVTDPTGPSSGSRRVMRGGYWHGSADYCTSAYRHSDSPSSTGGYFYNGYGFRLCCSTSLMGGDKSSARVGSKAGWLDLCAGTRIARGDELIVYSPSWGMSSICSIDADGEKIISNAADEGATVWNPQGVGAHTLTYEAGELGYSARYAVLGDDVMAHDGTIVTNETWLADKVHLVTATVEVPDGVTLTIATNAIVKFIPGTSITVKQGGHGIADGAILTHAYDDEIGGDTLFDGNMEKPVYGEFDLVGEWSTRETEIRYAVPLEVGGDISDDVFWPGGRTYIVRDRLFIGENATLTIGAGAVIKFEMMESDDSWFGDNAYGIEVFGKLVANGTRARPIVFTSLHDDNYGGDSNGDGAETVPQNGDWGAIRIYGSANFKYCRVRYGASRDGQGLLETQLGYYDDSWECHLELDNCILEHALGDGIWNNGGMVSVRNTVFSDIAIATAPYQGTNEFINCVFDSCEYGSMYLGGATTNFYANCVFSDLKGWVKEKSSSANVEGTPNIPPQIDCRNCLFWNPEDKSVQACTAVGSKGNVWGDPLFRDPDNGDFRVKDKSPCVDAADGTVAPERDYYNQARQTLNGNDPTGLPNANGAYPDIGIYEVQPRFEGSDIDLEIRSVTIPETLTVGEPITISWREANIGSADAVGQWHDKVELISANGSVVQLGIVSVAGISAGGEKMVEALFITPSVSEGNARVRVTANCDRDIHEGTLTANNLCLSEKFVNVILPTKGVGVFSSSVLSGQSLTFKLTDEVSSLFVSDPNDTLKVSMRVVDADTGKVHVVAGAIVGGGIVLSIPADVANVRLATVTIENTSRNAELVSCEATGTKCEVIESSPKRIGNKAPTIVVLGGFGMDYVSNVTMRGNGTVVPCHILSRSYGELAINVDGSGCNVGHYSLALELSDGSTLAVGDIEVFSNGVGPKLEAKLDVPAATRQGRFYVGRVRYANVGDADMVAPRFELLCENAEMGYDREDICFQQLDFVGIGMSAPWGVLKSGEENVFEFFFRSGASPTFILRHLYGTSDEWMNVARNIGNAATVLNARGRSVVALEEMQPYIEAVEAQSDAIAAICGSVEFDGEPQGTVSVLAETADGDAVSFDDVDGNGCFILDGLVNGSNYVVRVMGGASAAPVAVSMPDAGDYAGIVITASAKRRLSLSVEGVPEGEEADGLFEMSVGVDGDSIVAQLTNRFEVTYLSTNLYDVVYYKAKLTSGRIAKGCFVVSPYDIQVGMEERIDFSNTVVVTGKVFDNGGNPVAGGLVRVRAVDLSDYAEAVTSDDGEYVVGGLETGMYVADASFAGRTSETKTFEVDEGGKDLNFDFDLQGIDVGTIRFDIDSNGEELILVLENRNHEKSDSLAVSNGVITVQGIPRDEYDVYLIDMAGHLVSSVERLTVGDEMANVSLSVLHKVEVSGTISTFDSSCTNGVVSFSSIKGNHYRFTANEQGRFEGYVPSGKYWLAAAAEGCYVNSCYVDLSVSCEMSICFDANTSDAGSEEENEDKELEYNTKSIAGTIAVTDAVTVEFISVENESIAQFNIRAPNGEYSLKDAPAEYAYVWITDNFGRGVLRSKKDFEAGGYRIEMPYNELKTVSVRVFGDDERKEFLPNIIVAIMGGYSNIVARTTDAFGEAKFYVPDGVYELFSTRVFVAGCANQEVVVVGDSEIAVVLRAGCEKLLSTWYSQNTKEAWLASPQLRKTNLFAAKGIGDDVINFQSNLSGVICILSSLRSRFLQLQEQLANYISLAAGMYKEEPGLKCKYNLNVWKRWQIARLNFDTKVKIAIYNIDFIREAIVILGRKLLCKGILYNGIAGMAGDLTNFVMNVGSNLLGAIQSGLDGFNDIMKYAAEFSYHAESNVINSQLQKIDSGSWKSNMLKKFLKDSLADRAKNLNNLKTLSDWAGKLGKGLKFASDMSELYKDLEEIERYIDVFASDVRDVANAYAALARAYNTPYHVAGNDPCQPKKPPKPSSTNDMDRVQPPTPLSMDPNEIFGPMGVGNSDTERFVKPGEWMDYTIYFENKTNATAAAQDVYVTLPKDAGLDWTMFELGEVVFGENIDTALSGVFDGTSTYAIPGTNWSVRTIVEHTNDAVKWHLRIVDPTTPDNYPMDAYAGFLPPNDATGHGEGHLRYRVKVKDDATPGSKINASATLIFDYNDPIETDPAWWNTVAEMAGVKMTVDGVDTTLDLIVGQPYGELPVPAARSGYTFGGWWTAPGGPNGGGVRVRSGDAVTSGDHELYEYWLTHAYEVKFEKFEEGEGHEGYENVEGVMSNQAFEFDKAAALDACAYTLEGHTFGGWTTNGAAGAVYADCQVVSNLTDVSGAVVSLYATWSVNSYTVTFDYGYGGIVDSATQEYGTAIIAPDDVVREGYTFAGWEPAIPATVPASNVTYVAQWTPNEYIVTFDANGGVGGWTREMEYGAEIEVPTVTRDGYGFAGWEPDADAINCVPPEDVTFVAQWTPNKYTVTFDANGGVGGWVREMDFGSVLNVPVVTRDGYAFAGWSSAPLGTVPAEDVTFVAQWEKIVEYATVTITVDGVETRLVLAVGQPYGELPEPMARGGYVFGGWYTGPDGTGKRVNAQTIVDSGDSALYEYWLANAYLVRFNANGGTGVMSSQTYAFGESKPLDGCGFGREGHTFAGWAASADGDVIYGDRDSVANLASDEGEVVDLYAVWSVNSYVVAFDANGGIGGWVREMTYGAAILPPDVSREGHVFVLWRPALLAAVPAQDITFVAQWEEVALPPPPPMPDEDEDDDMVATVVVTLDANGGALAGSPRKVVQSGAVMGNLPEPVLGRHEFAGWFTEPDGGDAVDPQTVVTANMTIYAHWVKIPPKLWPEDAADAEEDATSAYIPADASIYNGCVFGDGGVVKGTFLVKVGKPKQDKKTGATTAKVSATVQMLGEKKATAKGEMDVSDGRVSLAANDGRSLDLKFAGDRMTGAFGGMAAEGSRNVFVSKDKGEQATANAALAQWLGPVNVAWMTSDGLNTMGVTISNKGKVKASGTLANGVKVSGTSQVIRGAEWFAVPVLIAKKAQLAFTLWLPGGGQGSRAKGQGNVEVTGLGDDVVAGKPESLVGGAKFGLDAEAFAVMAGDATFREYLPNGIAVKQEGTKWEVPKAGKVAYMKGTTDVDAAKAGENPSGLKLTYQAKTGAFKGSFKAYVVENGKVKALSAKIVGVMVKGIGYGMATIKKLGGIWVEIGR